MEKTEHNNSAEYWERRFSTRDWEDAHGEDQTRFFGRLATTLMPSWALSDIKANKRVVADLGCAEGAATAAFAHLLPECKVMGVDFAASAIARARELHPGLEFRVGGLDAPPPEASVLVLSNVLEHLQDPLGAMRKLAERKETHYLVVLVPLHEASRHHEHVVTFDYNNFPVRLGRLVLSTFDEIDLRGTPDERHWYGKQAFAIWASEEVLASEGPTLQGLVGAAQRSAQQARALSESVRKLESSDRRRLVELNDTRRQLTEAAQEVRRLEMAIAEARHEPAQGPGTGTRFLPDREAERRASALEQELEELRGTLKWRFSNGFAHRLERVGLGAGLRLARSLDREGVIGAAKRLQRSMRRRLRERNKPISYDVDPWVSLAALKPLEVKVLDRTFAGGALAPFAIVTTVRNEEDNILEFLRSVAAQKAAPSELIIVDGGSDDATVAIVREFALTSPFRVKVIAEGPCNIAAGRNRGLREVSEEIVVFIDAGCRLRPDFFSAMVGPFTLAMRVDLVGGIYLAAPGAHWAKDFIPDWQRCDFSSFLPSARAVAVRSSIARSIGGFPEHLSHTGEDTLFDISYRRVSNTWVINREAIVEWRGPANENASLKLSRSYSRGDGESGVGDRRFYAWLSAHLAGTLGPMDPLAEAAFAGFLEGRDRRTMVEMDRRRLRGVVIILDGSQLTDFGADRWVAQAATELTRQGVKVVHVSALGPDAAGARYLEIDQTMLELYHVNDFDPAEVAARYAQKIIGVLVERSHPALVQVAERLSKASAAPVVSFEPDEVSAFRVSPSERELAQRGLKRLLRGKIASVAPRPGTGLHLRPAADLRLFHRPLHELRPRDWPLRWKERVVVVPVPFRVSDAEGAALRKAAREAPTIGFVVLTADWRWPELQKRWGVVERNLTGAGWRTPNELAAWVAHAAAVVLPWSTEVEGRRDWFELWTERARAVGIPAVTHADAAQRTSGFGSQVAALINAPQAGNTEPNSLQANAHAVLNYLFEVGR